MSTLIVRPSQKLSGQVSLPGDKSISHRAIIFGSIAEGVTRVENLLEGEDVRCTIDIMRAMGVKIHKKGGLWRVQGKGIEGLSEPSKILYCGNSGTTLRLMTGFLSGLSFEVMMTGDASLNKRPMERVMEPLKAMGAKIEEIVTARGRFIRVKGGTLKGRAFQIPVASAQLKSALLLAGLTSGQKVSVKEPTKSRDHSERMLKAFGADIRVQGMKVTLVPGRRLKAQKVIVPGDFSSAAFFLVAALISQDPLTKIVVRNVGLNETRVGALEVLKKMGGRLRVFNKRIICGEPVGDIEARASSLKGTTIHGKILPRLIDEVPILCVAAAVAKGRTLIRDAGELRIKESDRIRALAAELPHFGVEVKEFRDGLEIRGHESIAGGRGQSYGDHRMAMSLAVLGTVARGITTVDDVDCIATSFPTFAALLKKVGGKVAARG